MSQPPPRPKRSFGLYAEAMGARSAVERALESRADEAKAPVFLDVWLPLILLGVGLVIEGWVLYYVMDGLLPALLAWVVALVVQVLILAPALFATIYAITRWFDLALGYLHIVLLKVGAITLGPAAAGDALFAAICTEMGFDWKGLVAAFGFYAILCGVPLAVLFRTGIPDTIATLAMIFVPRIILAYAVGLVFADLFP